MSIAARKTRTTCEEEATRLLDLDKLAAADIESPFVADIGRNLHSLFDPVCDDVLPIYFGPLLGRLYLEGL